MCIGESPMRWRAHTTGAHASAIEAVRSAGADGVEVAIFADDVAASGPLRCDFP